MNESIFGADKLVSINDLIGKTGMDFFRNKEAEILNHLDSENVDYSIQRHRFLDFTLSFQYCS